jgi:predicted transcriptional regulator of viral defense system
MEHLKVNREVLRRLARRRVLTTEDLSKILHVSTSRAARAAVDLKRRGLLIQVQRGIYASVPLEVKPLAFQPDPFLVVLRALGEKYAFSYLSALVLHGAEHTVRRTVHVSAPDARSRLRTVGRFPVHIHSVDRNSWGHATMRVRHGGASVRVTRPERTLVDLASLPNAQQDYEEDLQAFRTLVPRSDPRKLLREILTAPNITTRARVGHLLRVSQADTAVPPALLESIRESVSGASLSYFATKPKGASNRLDAEFRVIYPGRS